MSFYCDCSVSIYFTGYLDNLVAVSKLKNNVVLSVCHFARRDYILMDSNRRPFSLPRLRVLVDMWLTCILEPKLNRFARTAALVEVSLLSC